MIRRRIWLELLPLLLLSLWSTYARCAPLEKRQESVQEVLIGFSAPLTGISADIGSEMLNGARIAIQNLNRSRLRIGRRELRFLLDIQDNKSNVNFAKHIARYFVKRQVVAVVGGYGSDVALNTADIYRQAGIPHFAATAVRSYTNEGDPTAFRMTISDGVRADLLTQFTATHINVSKAGLIVPNTLFGDSFSKSLISALNKNGVAVSLKESISENSTDFSAQISRILENRPEVIFFGGGVEQLAALSKYLARAGLNIPLVAGNLVVESSYLLKAGREADGTVSLRILTSDDSNVERAQFKKDYSIEYNRAPGTYSGIAYDEVRLVAAAVVQSGSLNPRLVSTKLREIRLDGVIGRISFSPKGDLCGLNIAISRAQNQRWVDLTTYRTLDCK